MPKTPFHCEAIRLQFPSLNGAEKNKQPVYLDSAATTQKPTAVIECLHHYYSSAHANVHRGTHDFSQSSTLRFDAARQRIAQFLNAPEEGIIWTRGATEGINLIAQSYALNTLKKGDEILISEMEHHANLVPWQLVAKQTGAKIIKWPMIPKIAELDMPALDRLINKNTKILAVAHISNVTGTRHPVEKIIEKAHQKGVVVVLDGAQAVLHESVNLKKLNADFYVFSGHKIFGPEGIGVLYVNPKHLPSMPPWQGGGKIIEKVRFSETTFLSSALKFEPGTPNISGAIALACAIEWLESIDRDGAEKHIASLQAQFIQGISDIDGIQIFGLQKGASVVAFGIEGVHHSDLATLLDKQGIALRSGQHCAQPFIEGLGISGCLRVSIALYNTHDDILRCILAIKKACELL